MKKLVSILIIAILCIPATFAQKTIRIGNYNDQEINTVFKREKRDGFYGSFATGYSPIDNKNGLVFSSRGGWIMDHWFGFGMFGTGFVNDIDNLESYYNPSTSKDDYSLAGGYGGLFIEPMLLPLKPVHVSFPIMFGVGAATRFNNYNYYSDFYSDADFFYVVEPSVELEFNFTRWMRIALYGTYRYTSDISIENIAPSALRNYSAGVNVKIGLF